VDWGDSLRIIETYDTVDRTDPNSPIAKKGVVYIDENKIQQIIFVLPEELDAKIKEIEKP
jgi:hypothetical protein